jgi:hypothetical protein
LDTPSLACHFISINSLHFISINSLLSHDLHFNHYTNTVRITENMSYYNFVYDWQKHILTTHAITIGVSVMGGSSRGNLGARP